MATIRKKIDRKKVVKTANSRRFIKWFWIVVTAPFALLLLLLGLTAAGLFGPLPTFEELENPKSNLATEIISSDGKLLGSWFLENRSFVTYEELSPALVAALVSTEDKRYYGHSGIDFIGLARAVAFAGQQGGGSTITQQLAKNLYKIRQTERKIPRGLRYPRLIISKLKEWITAVGLEYNYTKEEIIAMYLNTMEYSENTYGIESAARTYFNKAPDELAIQEAAILIGLLNAQTTYNPRRNPENALRRRNLVLARMQEMGAIDRHRLDSLRELPIVLDFQPISHDTGHATYFRNNLKQYMIALRPARENYDNVQAYEQAVKTWDEDPLNGWIHKNPKADGTLYNLDRDGLKIYTTIDATMQQYAEEALFEHLKTVLQPQMEQQIKRLNTVFRRVTRSEIEEIMNRAMRNSDRYRAMRNNDMSAEDIRKVFDEQKFKMRVFTYNGDRDTLMTPMDSILHYKKILRASFMAMDPATGEVKAWVGGADYRYFKYDMVRQGKRQVGSTIKPFVYTFAIDHLGLAPCTPVPNLPVTIETYNGNAWSPEEAGEEDYDGLNYPLQWGLQNSRNNYSAWIMKEAREPQAVADYIRKLGITSYVDPVPSLCLGTASVSLFEMVSAYSSYANRGVHTEPVLVKRIEDRQGNVLATFTPRTSEPMSEQVAYTMLGMLRSVVDGGTAGRVRWLYHITGEVGGKTGTSQHNSDGWFIGVAPRLVAGGWVGAEDRSVNLISEADGARQALPVYAAFMNKVYANKSLGISMEDTFSIPLDVTVYDCGETTAYKENAARIDDEFFD